MNMEHGEYYVAIETNQDPDFPRLILGYVLNGKTIEIYKSRGTYIVVNMKTEKHLTCVSYEHAQHVFEECVRTLAPAGSA
jgi:hypothetical protein